MTHTILLASHNIDKYRLIRSLIEEEGFQVDVLSLDDLGIETVAPEEGTREKRACDKAAFYAIELAKLGTERKVDCILAVDDAIAYRDQSPSELTESWIATERLLSGRLADGVQLEIFHTLALKRGNSQIEVTTLRVPFVYRRPENSVAHLRDTYPLMEVVSIPGYGANTVVADLPFDEMVEYYSELAGDLIRQQLSGS